MNTLSGATWRSTTVLCIALTSGDRTASACARRMRPLSVTGCYSISCAFRLAQWEHQWRNDVGAAAARSHGGARPQFFAVLDVATIVPSSDKSAFLTHSLRTVHSRRAGHGCDAATKASGPVTSTSAACGAGIQHHHDDVAAQSSFGDDDVAVRASASGTHDMSVHVAPACVRNLGSTSRHPLTGRAGRITFSTYPLFGWAGEMYSGGFRIKLPASSVSHGNKDC